MFRDAHDVALHGLHVAKDRMVDPLQDVVGRFGRRGGYAIGVVDVPAAEWSDTFDLSPKGKTRSDGLQRVHVPVVFRLWTAFAELSLSSKIKIFLEQTFLNCWKSSSAEAYALVGHFFRRKGRESFWEKRIKKIIVTFE